MKNKVAQVLADASVALVKVASERDEALQRAQAAETKLAHVRIRLESEKLAADMHAKGLRAETEFSALADEVEKKAHEGQLAVIQEAVKMAAPRMGSFNLGNDETAGAGDPELVRYLVGNVG